MVHFQCRYTYTDKDGYLYPFDFTKLMTGFDYIAADTTGHWYNFNLCGLRSAVSCLDETSQRTAWLKPYRGVAIQFWGSSPDPTCQNKTCFQDSTPVCCTPPCEVLSTDWQPYWSLEDPNNPTTGGVRATLPGVRTIQDDVFGCPPDLMNGGELPRQVHVVFLCDPDQKDLVAGAKQNSTDDCDYEVYIRTKYACTKKVAPCGSVPQPEDGTGLNGGVVFLIVLLVLIAVYIVGGYLINKFVFHKTEFPNLQFWRWVGRKITCGRACSNGRSND